jgi:cytochrome c-type biogenesis protein CcmH
MSRRRFPLWTLLLVVAVIALVIGSGVLSSTPPTPAQRASALESAIRCPTCEDLSVAQSTAPTAVAVRSTIASQIAEGRTDQQIEAYLVDRYGTAIVLDPPATGWSLLVWLLPLLGGLAAATVLVVVLVRRRRLDDGGDKGASGRGDPGDGPGLAPEAAEDRRVFLSRSLADADAEYLAGDLSDQDYLALRQRDMRRLAALEAAPTALADTVAAPATARAPVAVDEREAEAPDAGADGSERDGAATPARPRRRIRRSAWFLAGAVVAFAAALVMAVTLFASARQPGQSITGSFAQSATQQIEETLAQAATDENQGQAGQAAQLYQSVLDRHPDNEVALAQLGWLEYQTGRQGSSASLIADARAKLLRSVALDPGDYAARLYLGSLLFDQDGNAAGAVDQFRQFLADQPPAALLTQAASEIRAAFQQAGQAVPASVPAA